MTSGGKRKNAGRKKLFVKRKLFSIRIKPPLKNDLSLMASKRGITMSKMIESLINDETNRHDYTKEYKPKAFDWLK